MMYYYSDHFLSSVHIFIFFSSEAANPFLSNRPRKRVFGHRRTEKAKIRLHPVQSDLGLRCLLTASLHTIECINVERIARMRLCACAE